MSRMYDGVKSWTVIVGCEFGCVYCKPSFQRQAKRWKRWCERCYRYEPHFHEDRLKKVPKADTIFIAAFGDIAFADIEWIQKIFDVVENYPEKKFYLQTKCPTIYRLINDVVGFPENVLCGVTLESDVDVYNTPSEYSTYMQISNAPTPSNRLEQMHEIPNLIDFVTVEPILDFSNLAEELSFFPLDFVYVGYDNHNCKLPEPPLHKTEKLIEELKKFTEVRLKTIRKAWWE